MRKAIKKLWERQNSQEGFTLVELIVVLVILAILAAIMVPSLVGWIDKAREKQIVVEARSVYLAAQTLASEEYGKPSPDRDNITAAQIEELSGVDQGTVSGIEYKGTTGKDAFIVTGITYTKDGMAAVYENEQWTVE